MLLNKNDGNGFQVADKHTKDIFWFGKWKENA